jgi:nitrite reductase/ring-hydroxylating ferredoxin subunit
MTHDGPFGSSSAMNKQFYNNDTCYHAGAPHLTKLILENQEKILCNIHGHTHDGSFM